MYAQQLLRVKLLPRQQRDDRFPPGIHHVLPPHDHQDQHAVDTGQKGQNASRAQQGQGIEQKARLGEHQSDQTGFQQQQHTQIPQVANRRFGRRSPPQRKVQDRVDERAHRQAVQRARAQPQPVPRFVQVRALHKGHVGVETIGRPQRHKAGENHDDGGGRKLARASPLQHHGLSKEPHQRPDKRAATSCAERELAAGDGERVTGDAMAHGVADHVRLGQQSVGGGDEKGPHYCHCQ